MLDSLHRIDVEFYKVLLGDSLVDATFPITTHKGETKNVLLNYVKKSAYDYTEGLAEGVSRDSSTVPGTTLDTYPILSIENFTPELVPDFYFPNDPYYAAHRDTDDDGFFDTVTQYQAQIPMRFKYELNAAAKSESEWDAMKLYMFKKFSFRRDGYFLFNKKAVPLNDSLNQDTFIGDNVNYKFEWEDVPRTDGVFETVFRIIILAWLDIKDPQDYDLIKTLNVNGGGDTLTLENNTPG